MLYTALLTSYVILPPPLRAFGIMEVCSSLESFTEVKPALYQCRCQLVKLHTFWTTRKSTPVNSKHWKYCAIYRQRCNCLNKRNYKEKRCYQLAVFVGPTRPITLSRINGKLPHRLHVLWNALPALNRLFLIVFGWRGSCRLVSSPAMNSNASSSSSSSSGVFLVQDLFIRKNLYGRHKVNAQAMITRHAGDCRGSNVHINTVIDSDVLSLYIYQFPPGSVGTRMFYARRYHKADFILKATCCTTSPRQHSVKYILRVMLFCINK